MDYQLVNGNDTTVKNSCPVCGGDVKQSIIRNAATHKRKTCTECRWGYIKG